MSYLILAGFVGLPLLAGMVIGHSTRTGMRGWYEHLNKSRLNPPKYVFGPVWTTLYICMGTAAYRVYLHTAHAMKQQSLQTTITQVMTGKHSLETLMHPSAAPMVALGVYSMSLVFNFVWSFLHFRFHRLDLSMIDSFLLLASVCTTGALFYRVDPLSGYLFIPYAAWCTLASTLCVQLYRKNPGHRKGEPFTGQKGKQTKGH